MPKVKRKRVIGAPRMEVWNLVSDPYHLARWWPRVKRVEAVYERKGGSGTRWTNVFAARSGRDLRSDFRCTHSRKAAAYGWEQEVADSPFRKLLRSAMTTIDLADAGDSATSVTIGVDQRFRGLNRLGGLFARSAARRQLDEALDGIARAIGDEGNRS
ncbi:MAG: SRPBCC family protein [Solirubrobacterales bacterium]